MLALARALMLDPGPAPRRTVRQPLAEDGRLHLREDRRDQPRRHRHAPRRAERPRGPQLQRRAYVLAMGENRFEGDAKGMLDNEEVGRLYLGA